MLNGTWKKTQKPKFSEAEKNMLYDLWNGSTDAEQTRMNTISGLPIQEPFWMYSTPWPDYVYQAILEVKTRDLSWKKKSL